MRKRASELILVSLLAACGLGPTEGSKLAARQGATVEVLLVAFDSGATLAEGAGAFDATVATTDSLEGLALGRGAFVIAVADGAGVALVPLDLTDDVQLATGDAVDAAPVDEELPVAPASCARDCAEWCSTLLDLCDGDGSASCDCSGDEPAPEEEIATCTWDCDEWCVSPVEWCGQDGWAECADLCEAADARPVPPSAFAGQWSAPTIVDGVSLAIGVTDPVARDALSRSQPIGRQVGGAYGRQADEVLARLLEAVAGAGVIRDDPSLSCGQRLLNRGYRPTQSFASGETVRVGICQNDGLEVWPMSIGLKAASATRARFVFEHLPLGTGTSAPSGSDVVAWWGDTGTATVPAGRSTAAELPIDPGVAFPLDVFVPRTGNTTRVRVTVQR
jgi:hypothetical protein